jgi:putative ABC transport system substrate-binding protein
MRRRELSIAVALGLPFGPAGSQTAATPHYRIGYLDLSTEVSRSSRLQVFKESFKDYGFIEGQDYVLVARFADNRPERLERLADELVSTKPDLLMARSTSPVRALQSATKLIPIVMITSGDPVGGGLVESLARPGGTITGTSNSLTDIASKSLDILHVTLPHAAKVAVLFYPAYPAHVSAVGTLRQSAQTVQIQLIPIAIESVDEIAGALARASQQKVDALIVVTDPTFYDRGQQIAQLAIAGRMASIGYSTWYADAGFLIGYGPNPYWFYRRTAYFATRILRGGSPADMPVEQPTTFEMAVNLRTARALGLVVPQSMLLRADRVIE